MKEIELKHKVTTNVFRRRHLKNGFIVFLNILHIYSRKGGTIQSKSVDLTAEQIQGELGLGVCTG